MSKKKYPIRNWGDYNKGLEKRGEITFWFSEEVIQKWNSPEPTGKKGHPYDYSDLAIQALLCVKVVFHLKFRSLKGFGDSLVAQLGWPITIPSYSQICRRQKGLCVPLSRSVSEGESIHVLVDTTGLKVFGEGEWKVRRYGYSKRRTWRKLHLAVNAITEEIVAEELTTNAVGDNEKLPSLLDQIPEDINSVTGDGGYDCWDCYDAMDEREAQAKIPPQRNAKIKQHGNSQAPPLARDEAIRAIRKHGRHAWKISIGYHRRSLVETAMFRFKTLFGHTLSAHLFEHQLTEARIKCLAMNRMTSLGMPLHDTS